MEHLLKVAKALRDAPVSDDDLNKSVHIRDLKTIIARLIEKLEEGEE